MNEKKKLKVKIFDKEQGEQVTKAFVSDEEVSAVLAGIK